MRVVGHQHNHDHGGPEPWAEQGHRDPRGAPGETRKTLILFLDNLHTDVLTADTMPAVHAEATEGALASAETVLGYSSAIRNTIFTGAPPDVHDRWSKFKYAPDDSPFDKRRLYRAIEAVPGGLLQRCVRFACSKTIVRKQGRDQGYPFLSIENVPADLLPYFDFTEDDVTKGGRNVETLFDVLREHGVSFEYLSLPLSLGGRQLARIEKALEQNDVVFVYLYNLDAAGHRFGTDSRGFRVVQAHVDRFAEKVLRLARRRWGDMQFFCFSDHGMTTITKHLNLAKHLKRTAPGFQEDYLCFIDSTMARFWYRTERARVEVHAAMQAFPEGRFLTSEERLRYGINFQSPAYGEEIFLLPSDSVFHPAYVSWMKPTGMHGYACDDPSQDGVFIWNDGSGPRRLPERISMVDIAPTILRSLDLPAPSSARGTVFQ